MTLKAMLAILIAFCGVMGFGYWRYQVGAQAHPVAQFGFIQDPSDSIQDDCGRILGLTKRALSMKQTGGGSTITLFALGSGETANEPRLLAEFEIPVIRRVIEGQRAAAREKDALLANVQNKCGEVKETRVSPIFQAVKRGVEHMQSVGATYDQRYLFVQTDGEETENAKLKRALNLAPGAASSLPTPIPNKDVRVMFCGMAETIGETHTGSKTVQQKSRQRDERRSDRLREVWAKVFTNPELVTFEPYCSR